MQHPVLALRAALPCGQLSALHANWICCAVCMFCTFTLQQRCGGCRWGMRGRIWCLFLYQASAGLWVALLGHSSGSYPATIAFIVLAAFAMEVSLHAPFHPSAATGLPLLLCCLCQRSMSCHAACQKAAEGTVTHCISASRTSDICSAACHVLCC